MKLKGTLAYSAIVTLAALAAFSDFVARQTISLDGKRQTEILRFAPTPARWVRLHATRRATQYGCSLFEMAVYH